MSQMTLVPGFVGVVHIYTKPYDLSKIRYNSDFAFFVFERTKHQPRRHLRSYLVLQRLCKEAALSPGIDAFLY